jgi:cell division protein FtsI (penicillin-binding protein 3)
VGWLQIVSPDNLVKQEDMRSLREEPIDAAGNDQRPREPPAGGQRAGERYLGRPANHYAKGGVGYGPRWQAMAEALHLNLSELAQRVESHPHMRFIYLARQVNPEQAEWIDKLHLPGSTCAMSRAASIRGHVAANLLGFTNIDNQGIEGLRKL